MFTGELRQWLSTFKYACWADSLTEEQLKVLLWAVGEFGHRSRPVLECLARHEIELLFEPGAGYPRARVGLQVIRRMTSRTPVTADEMNQMLDAACSEMADSSSFPEDPKRFADLWVTPRFWALIDAARGAASTMRSILQGLSRDDLLRFKSAFDGAIEELLWRVGEGEGKGDGGEAKVVAASVVSQGVAYYASVFDNPERFRAAPPTDGGFDGLADLALDELPKPPPTSDAAASLGRWPGISGFVLMSLFGTP
jgi:hypothetical protein